MKEEEKNVKDVLGNKMRGNLRILITNHIKVRDLAFICKNCQNKNLLVLKDPNASSSL